MHLQRFQERFEREFPARRRQRPAWWLRTSWLRRRLDPCPDVTGMSSLRKLRLLDLAVGCLEPGEGYLEVGTYHGKTLIAALQRHRVPAVACDNFSEFTPNNSAQILRDNLLRHGLAERVSFFDGDFRDVLDRGHVPFAVGVYLYDGAHDEVSQYDGIHIAEALLADTALVIVDDWRLADDSQSYARAGTERAIAASPHRWKLLYDLPARFNGDHALWWNGIAVYSFERAGQPGQCNERNPTPPGQSSVKSGQDAI